MMTKQEALQRAQAQANATRVPFGVWEHVGDYGRPGGDIPASHAFKVQSESRPDPARVWALIAIAEPEQEVR